MPNRRRLAFLIEDNPVIRGNLVLALEELADVSVVDFAENEEDALRWIRSHSHDFELIVLDMFLAGGSGLGVLAGLKAMGNSVPVIVLTNHDTADMRRRSAEAGALAFFDKAQQAETFFEYVRQMPYLGTKH